MATMRDRGLVKITVTLAVGFCLSLAKMSFAADDPIRIGWIGALSGVLASYGLDNKRGVEFAVEQVNAKGGVKGRKLELIYVDSKFDPAFSVQAVQRLAMQDRVVAILGDISSALTLAQVPVTAKLGVPQLASLAGTPRITEMGSQFIFRPYPSVTLTYSTLAVYATQKMNLNRFATLAYNDEGGLASIDAFKQAITKGGKGQIVASEVVPVDTKEFKPILSKIRESNPDGLVLAAAASVSGLISKQARELGWNVQLLGHGGYQAVPEYRDIAGPAGDGMVLATTYAPGLYQHTEAKKFVTEWSASHGGQLPRDMEAHGYDQINMLVWALSNGPPERKAIRDNLAKLNKWPGVAGIYTFLSNGDVDKDLIIQAWKGGKLVPLEVYGRASR